jgi:predicted CxxxxCH...CXXCH cytochrome family protein
LDHYNRAKSRVAPGDAAFLATYFAKTGASSFDNGAALSCSNVSCHGGQATPNWQTGALVVNDQCTICHEFGTAPGTPQYNSPYSGKHNINTPTFPGAHQTCTFCHNTTALELNHFTTLADNTISPDVASATIGGEGTAIITWTQGTGSSGTCLAACHSSTVRTW